MVSHRALHDLKADLRNSLLRLAVVALSVAACSSLHRVPNTAPMPASSTAPAAEKPEAHPLFTSREGPPTTFVKSNSEARTTRSVVLRNDVSNEALFRTASDYLKSKYTIYVSDPKAGFLMTQWEAPFVRDGAPELRYRRRIILRFFGDEYWKQLTVTSEANWLRGDEWEIGYDAAVLDSVSAQLATKLGRRS